MCKNFLSFCLVYMFGGNENTPYLIIHFETQISNILEEI
jgi:hypothetical protein